MPINPEKFEPRFEIEKPEAKEEEFKVKEIKNEIESLKKEFSKEKYEALVGNLTKRTLFLKSDEYGKVVRKIKEKATFLIPPEENLATFDEKEFRPLINESLVPEKSKNYVDLHEAVELLNLELLNYWELRKDIAKRKIWEEISQRAHYQALEEEYSAAAKNNDINRHHQFMVNHTEGIKSRYKEAIEKDKDFKKMMEQSLKEEEEVFQKFSQGEEFEQS